MTQDNEFKISLLKDSIQDIQQTIRAIDVKAGFFLVILCLPFSSMDKILPILMKLSQVNDVLLGLTILLFVIWTCSLWLLVYCLIPVDNPKENIDFNGVEHHPEGFIYGGYFSTKLGFFKFFIPTSTLNGKYEIKKELDYIEHLTYNQYVKELQFDRLKLIVIRNVKVKRLKASNICLIFSFILIFILSISYLLKGL